MQCVVVVSFLLKCMTWDRVSGVDLEKDVGSVIYTNMLYRHGERTIIDPGPGDPNGDPKYWPLGYGQLTKEGVRHHFHLGQWLRKRYNHLIGNGEYNTKLIRVQSTDYDRTLMSAEANLAGMFPPDSDEVWSNIKWQPIPIHSVPLKLDKLVAMDYPCKSYQKEFLRFKDSYEFKKLNAKYKDLYDYITQHYGQKVDNPLVLQYLYSNLLIESLNNLTLPEWTKEIFPDKMIEPSGLSFALSTWNPFMKRLKGGPLLKQMLVDMDDKVKGITERNISVYSAHDSTVAAFLNTLGVFNFLPPPFASLVLVELRNSPDNKHFVTVLFKNSTDPMGDSYLLELPDCGTICPLEKMKDLYKPIIPLDWDVECHQHDFFDLSSDQPYNTIAIFAMVTSIMIVFLVMVSSSLYWSKQRPKYLYKRLNIEPL